MASVSQWDPYDVALDLTATVSSVTRTSATKYTVKYSVKWETHWDTETNFGMKATSGDGSVVLNAFGKYAQSGSGTLTASYSISGNGSASKSSSVKFTNWEEDGHGTVIQSASKSISLSYTVPAWTSYTVSYNANGGSGAPSAQTKWKDQALTLSTTKPTRTGYSFKGWATSSGGSVAYASGGTIAAGTNQNLTLYAVWQANTYTVSYNANGGTGAPGNQTKTYGVTLTLSSTKPTRTNYNFKGWATSAGGSVKYAAGGSYTSNSNITLYAVWELAYIKPRISSLSAARCDSSGSVTDEGTYGLIKFKWETDKTVSSVKITCNGSTTSVSASGTSGDVNQPIGSGNLSAETSYTVTVTVTDSNGSSSASVTLLAMNLPIDVKANGNGVAFGKPADLDGYLDSQYPIMARDQIYLGRSTSDSVAPIGGIHIHDLRNVTPDTDMFGNNRMNVYFDKGGDDNWKSILHLKGWGSGYAAHQLAFNAHTSAGIGDLFHRTGLGSSWNGWRTILDSYNYSSYALPKAGGTVTGALNVDGGFTANSWVDVFGTLYLNKTTDAAIDSDNRPALIVGPYNASHIEIDQNEILAKANGTSRATLYLGSTGDTVVIRNFSYGVNNVLWSGGSYMSDGQTATLSNAVTNQAHGIVLIWSAYVDGASANQNFNTTFVPKYFVSAHGGKGVGTWLTNGTGSIVGSKYVYVSDTKITGYSGNSTGETWRESNFHTTNNYWVLRYVVGV